jgi:hypothetical protein
MIVIGMNAKFEKAGMFADHLLQKVDEFPHIALMPRGPEDISLEGSLLVQLQEHHLLTHTDTQNNITGRDGDRTTVVTL